MGELSYVHIVDADVKRRNAIANQLYGGYFHPEIYENWTELLQRAPAKGALLINDDPDTSIDFSTLTTVRRAIRYLPLAFFSEAPTPDRIVRAMRAGAIDYFNWPLGKECLQSSLERLISEGERTSKIEIEKLDARTRVGRLSSRQLEILHHLVCGESNKYIALELGVSPRTVEVHRSQIMRRLGAVNIADAVRIGLLAFWNG